MKAKMSSGMIALALPSENGHLGQNLKHRAAMGLDAGHRGTANKSWYPKAELTSTPVSNLWTHINYNENRYKYKELVAMS